MKPNYFARSLVEAPCALTTTGGPTQPVQTARDLKSSARATMTLYFIGGFLLLTMHAGAQTKPASPAAIHAISPQTTPCVSPQAVTGVRLGLVSQPCAPDHPLPPPPPPDYGTVTYYPKYYV